MPPGSLFRMRSTKGDESGRSSSEVSSPTVFSASKLSVDSFSKIYLLAVSFLQLIMLGLSSDTDGESGASRNNVVEPGIDGVRRCSVGLEDRIFASFSSISDNLGLGDILKKFSKFRLRIDPKEFDWI